MDNRTILTIIIVLAVIGVLYMTYQPEKQVNYTRQSYSGLYSGHLAGNFTGNTNQTGVFIKSNISGNYNGFINYFGQIQKFEGKILGFYSGNFNGKFGQNYIDGRIDGEFNGTINGYVLIPVSGVSQITPTTITAQLPTQEPKSDTMTWTVIIAALGIVIYYLYKKSSWYPIDEAEIKQRCKKYLLENESLIVKKFYEAMWFGRDERKVKLLFELGEPYLTEFCCITYEKGKFYNLVRNLSVERMKKEFDEFIEPTQPVIIQKAPVDKRTIIEKILRRQPEKTEFDYVLEQKKKEEGGA